MKALRSSAVGRRAGAGALARVGFDDLDLRAFAQAVHAVYHDPLAGLQRANPGFDTARLLTLRVFMTGEAYATEDQRARRIDDIVQRIESLPQVQAAFASNFVPLDAGGGGGNVIIDGKPVAPG